MKRPGIVLTGATGFVGRRLLARLLEQGRSVRVLARDPDAMVGVDAVRWEPGAVDPGLLEGASAVCHLAAYIPTDHHDPREAETCVRVNAHATLDLVSAARAAGLGTFVFMSSGNIYAPARTQAREDSRIWPVGHAAFYLSSKALGDMYVEHAHQRGWLRGVQLRPSAIYGPGMKGGVVPALATRLLAGERARVQDGGRYQVDLVHVDDVVDATLAAVDRPVHGAFNIGSGRLTTVLEMAKHLATALDVPEERLEVAPAGDGPAGGFPALDISRARELLDYEPVRPDQGLAAYARHLRDQA